MGSLLQMGDRLSLPEMAFVLSMFVALLGGLLNCDSGGTPEIAPSPSRPNIVLIIIDTLRADMLGAYGFPLPTSPEFDSYSREGVRFSHVVTPNTWTRPSHGALLTSLHPAHLWGSTRRRVRYLQTALSRWRKPSRGTATSPWVQPRIPTSTATSTFIRDSTCT